MSNDTPENTTSNGQSFRTLRDEAGLPSESRSDGIEGLLHGGPMQDMAQIMEMMRRKAERQAAEAEVIANLPLAIPVPNPPNNLIHFPQRAANGENG